MELSKQIVKEEPENYTIKKSIYWLNMQHISVGRYQEGPYEHIWSDLYNIPFRLR
jgi:hypothetical protein